MECICLSNSRSTERTKRRLIQTNYRSLQFQCHIGDKINLVRPTIIQPLYQLLINYCRDNNRIDLLTASSRFRSLIVYIAYFFIMRSITDRGMITNANQYLTTITNINIIVICDENCNTNFRWDTWLLQLKIQSACYRYVWKATPTTKSRSKCLGKSTSMRLVSLVNLFNIRPAKVRGYCIKGPSRFSWFPTRYRT